MDLKFVFYLCITIIYYNIQTESAAAIATPNSYNIEEFIQILLNSNKFDELTDKIADKAARKVISLEKNIMSTLRTSKEIVGPGNSQPSDSKIEEVDFESEESEKKIKRDKKKLKLDKITRIDTRAFMEKNIFDSTEKLILNYKYLTQAQKQKGKQNGNIDSKSIERQFEKQNVEENITFPKKETSKKKIKNTESIETRNPHSKSNSDMSSEDISMNSKEKNQDVEEINHLRNTESLKGENGKGFTTFVASKENNNNQSHEILEEKHDNTQEIAHIMRSHSKKNRLEENIMDDFLSDSLKLKPDIQQPKLKQKPFIVKNGILHSEINDDSFENKVFSKGVNKKTDSNKVFPEKKKETKPSRKKHLVREELGKLFTFESSPDYAEYHENIAKLSVV